MMRKKASEFLLDCGWQNTGGDWWRLPEWPGTTAMNSAVTSNEAVRMQMARFDAEEREVYRRTFAAFVTRTTSDLADAGAQDAVERYRDRFRVEIVE